MLRNLIWMVLVGINSLSAAPHSAIALTAKQRGFWWNQDYLELVAKRIDLSSVRRALDVGCGKGAWTKVIGSVLPEEAEIIGVDRESEWIKSVVPSSSRFSFAIADAHHLPFEDESFDLVTCQTLLMHVPDCKKVLEEMARVLKPGGIMILSEPNNMANLADSNTAQEELSLQERMDATKLYLICQEGRRSSGEGFFSIGTHLSYLLPSSINCIHSFMSEKMMVLTPPYANEEEEALLDFVKTLTKEDWYYLWSKEQALKYFLAIYPNDEVEFQRLWNSSQKLNGIYRKQIEERRLGGVFGGHLILTIGKKHK